MPGLGAPHQRSAGGPPRKQARRFSQETMRAIALLTALNQADAKSSAVHPLSPLRAHADVVVVCVALLSALITPVYLAFGRDLGVEVSWTLSALLFFDVVLNFFTGFERCGAVVMGQREIVRHYLRGAFWIDLVATIPWTLVRGLVWEVHLLNFLALARLPRTFRRLELVYQVRNATSKLTRFFLIVVLTSHMLSCAFWALGCGPDGWVTERGLDYSDVWGGYVASQHWAIMTLTTIGYGDIVPVTTHERLFVLGAMVIGAGIFAYSVGDIVDLALHLTARQDALRGKLDRAGDFGAFYDLPVGLQGEIRSFYLHKHSWDTTLIAPHEEEIIREVPRLTRRKIAVAINPRLVKRLPFLRNSDPCVTLGLALRLKDLYLAPREIVFRQGDVADAMYFIAAGAVDVFRDGVKVSQLGQHQYFGEAAIVQPDSTTGRVATAKAAAFSKLHVLTQEQVMEVLQEFPPEVTRDSSGTNATDEVEDELECEGGDCDDPFASATAAMGAPDFSAATDSFWARVSSALSGVARGGGDRRVGPHSGGASGSGTPKVLPSGGSEASSTSRASSAYAWSGGQRVRISDGSQTIDFASSACPSPARLMRRVEEQGEELSGREREEARVRLVRERWQRAFRKIAAANRFRSALAMRVEDVESEHEQEEEEEEEEVISLSMHASGMHTPSLSPKSRTRVTFGTGLLDAQRLRERMSRVQDARIVRRPPSPDQETG